MEIKIEPILIEQKSVLVQLMELYNYDFSMYSDDDVNEYGYFGYSHIDDYWNENGRFPYFIRVDNKLAGLVFVRSCCEFNKLSNPHNIAEFFIMQKYRRKFLICIKVVGKLLNGQKILLPKSFGNL